MIETLGKTILWIANNRMKKESYQNLNSCIHSILLETQLYLIEHVMKGGKQ